MIPVSNCLLVCLSVSQMNMTPTCIKPTCLFVKHLSADPLIVFQLPNEISETKQKNHFQLVNGWNKYYFPSKSTSSHKKELILVKFTTKKTNTSNY